MTPRFLIPLTLALAAIGPARADDAPPDFAAVYRVLDERCVECHTKDDPENDLVLETYEGLLKGGETGAAITAGKSGESLLVKYLRGEVEKDGKKKFMPPGKREKLDAAEITLICKWIDAGAKPPLGALPARELHLKKIAPKVAPRGSINALAFSPQAKVLAVGRYGVVEIVKADTREVLRRLEGHKGNVNALVFSADGATLFAASGENALTGEVRVWNVADGAAVRTIAGHRDTVYALALSPDGQTLATGSYDQQIKLWNVASGAEVRTLRGHNGAVFAIAFRPDGKLLASASADRTVKLWDAASGARKDTLAQPLKEQVALAWSPDGTRLAAAGFDNRIRIWEVSADAKETTNPLAIARFAHEQPISRLAWSADGKTIASAAQDGVVKLWDAGGVKERALIDKQPDWPSALAFAGDVLVVGRLDGTFACYAAQDGAPRGADASSANVERAPRPSPECNPAPAAPAPPPPPPIVRAPAAMTLPAEIAGTIDKPGARDRIEFDAKAGATIVFDLAAKSAKSNLDAALSIVDADGHVLASNHDFDTSGDPFIAHTFKADGRYAVLVGDAQFLGSAEHTYKLNAGATAFVSAVFPLSIPANAETEVELIGYNLPPDAGRRVKVPATAGGEVVVPIDAAKFRKRGDFKVIVDARPAALETEPNDTPAQAQPVSAPVSIGGRIGAPGDADVFKFDAKKGGVWAIETQAAQRGSPVDTRIEVLDAQGRKVERALLQAVRDSAITFRGIDSATNDVRLENWREMELNQLVFFNGEISKLFRMPEGPDSGFQLYSPSGKRTAYFDTTATAHGLDEPCYIVEPHPPGTRLTANGLPTFTLFFENDDDGERKLGTDSRLIFTAPADGAYLVRVTDSSGAGGERNAYRLIIRETAPDFSIRLDGAGATVNAGSGQAFSVVADRRDGFDEDITVEIAGVPAGYKASSPLVIQAGHSTARGTINALPGAAQLDDAAWAAVKVTAKSGALAHDANNLGKITLGKDPQVWIALEPAAPGDTIEKLSPVTPLQTQDPAKPFEITIAPGEIIPAWMKIKRNGHDAELRFDVENLPHGVIVDDLGLNGITLLAGQNEGEIRIKAEPWVKEMDRLCHAITREAGKQTSLPVVLHVRNKPGVRAQTVTVK